VTTRKRPKPASKAAPKAKARPARARTGAKPALRLRAANIDALRKEVEKRSSALEGPARWNANPEDVQRSVAQLVLALVEFLRKLLERQAIRRMEGESLDPDEIERVGLALMRLEQTVHELARRFDLEPEDLNLDLGPLGRLV
jgi:predicted transcriptional regulator